MMWVPKCAAATETRRKMQRHIRRRRAVRHVRYSSTSYACINSVRCLTEVPAPSSPSQSLLSRFYELLWTVYKRI